MKKLYSFVFPLWLILILPPVILILFVTLFIINTIAITVGLNIIKSKEILKKYRKIILKSWIISIITYIIGSGLLLCSQFMPQTSFVYNYISHPLALNPFKSIIAIIYLIIVLIICGLLIYILNRISSLKKIDIDDKQKHLIALIITLITIPYTFLIPTDFVYKVDVISQLEQYKGSYVGDNSAVGNIVNRIDSGKYYSLIQLVTSEKPYQIIINYKDGEYDNLYQTMEKDATILFNLVKNVDVIKFNVNDKSYEFDYENLNIFYDNELRNKSLNEINKVYEHANFKDYTYYGLINGYQIFDTSEYCSTNLQQVYSDEFYRYLIECSSLNNLYLIKENEKINIKEALNNKVVTIEDLLKTSLKIQKENR